MSRARSASRRWRRRPLRDPRRAWAAIVAGLAVACGLVIAGAPSQGAAAKAPDLIRSHKWLSVQCVPGPSNTVRARIKVRMTVVNYEGLGGDWADHMEAKARLEPTTAGLNFTRRWSSWKTPYLVINKRHSYVINLTTDNLSATKAWKVHLKLIWHRTFPTRNIALNLYGKFNGGCTNGLTGASI